MRFEAHDRLPVSSRSRALLEQIDASAARGHVELYGLACWRVRCDVTTDGVGHAHRFVCRGFPTAGSLAGLELRLDVAGDRKLGVFAGIGELEPTVEAH